MVGARNEGAVKLSLLSSHVVLLAITFAAGCATAVSQTSDTSPPTGDAGATKDSGIVKKDAGSSSTQDSGSTTTADGGDVSPPDDSTCAATSTRADCEQCCLKVHPTGYQVYDQELVSCACTSPGDCASVCATETCANSPTTSGDACEQCITASLTQGTGSCYDGVAAACQSDVDCTALFGTCIPPCESK